MECPNCGELMKSQGFEDGGCNDAGTIAEIWECPACGMQECKDLGFPEELEDDE